MHPILEAQHLLQNLEKFGNRLASRKKTLANLKGETIGEMLRPFRDAVVYAICGKASHAEILRHLRMHKIVALGNFQTGTGQPEFHVDFDGEDIPLAPNPKTSFMSVDEWKRAFDACLILRDMPGLQFLATIDEQVFVNSNGGASKFDLAYFRFLAHFFTGGHDTGKWLIDVMTEANEPQDNSVRQDFVDCIRYPELMLYQSFVLGDVEAFNSALHDALDGHRKFYGSATNENDTDGWVSFPILSACVLASDSKKFQMQFESDYIPHWLILGEGIIGR